jgi:hypothetical protein
LNKAKSFQTFKKNGCYIVGCGDCQPVSCHVLKILRLSA